MGKSPSWREPGHFLRSLSWSWLLTPSFLPSPFFPIAKFRLRGGWVALKGKPFLSSWSANRGPLGSFSITFPVQGDSRPAGE